MWVVIPITLFFVAIDATYAYFTSTLQETKTTATARLTIEFGDTTKTFANSTEITNSTLILPGDTIVASGTVENSGNVQAYVIIKFKLSVTKSGSSNEELIDEKYYTIHNSNLQEITVDGNSISHNAFIMNGGASQPFAISYQLDFDEFNNDYKQAKLSYSLQACAIQTTSLPDAAEATTLLINQVVED